MLGNRIVVVLVSVETVVLESDLAVSRGEAQICPWIAAALGLLFAIDSMMAAGYARKSNVVQPL